MKKNCIKGLSMVKASKYRSLVLYSLKDGILTPSEISKKTDIRLNHVSNILIELAEADLVECLNKEAKKGRLYNITELGNEVLKHA